MNSLNRQTRMIPGVFFRDMEWLLNVYIIQSNENEDVADEEAYRIIDIFLEDIENHGMSEEFVYFRTGFAFLHYGNRGVDLSIWHVGSWGSTIEVFNRTWYCYNRDLDKMEALDDAEPVISQYEIGYLNAELNEIADIIKELPDKIAFRDHYMKYHGLSGGIIAPGQLGRCSV